MGRRWSRRFLSRQTRSSTRLPEELLDTPIGSKDWAHARLPAKLPGGPRQESSLINVLKPAASCRPKYARSSCPTSYSAALEFLLSRIDYERSATVPYNRREFHLERMHELLDRLGNPHKSLKVVHIAGTKGKGSTAAMIAAILSAAGYRTGLYTSPHLDRIEERLAIDGCPCSPEQFVELLERVRPVVEAMDGAGLRVGFSPRESVQGAWAEAHATPEGDGALLGPTYFEITTAMAFLHFAEQAVDMAVVEVGLGGRLDSTNVVRPLVSVITSISFDHMKQLGATLDAIAREKAGIIKPGVPVVSSVLGDEPRWAIEEVARRCGSTISQLGVDFDFAYRPPHQVDNAAAHGEIDFFLRRAICDVAWASAHAPWKIRVG